MAKINELPCTCVISGGQHRHHHARGSVGYGVTWLDKWLDFQPCLGRCPHSLSVRRRLAHQNLLSLFTSSSHKTNNAMCSVIVPADRPEREWRRASTPTPRASSPLQRQVIFLRNHRPAPDLRHLTRNREYFRENRRPAQLRLGTSITNTRYPVLAQNWSLT